MGEKPKGKSKCLKVHGQDFPGIPVVKTLLPVQEMWVGSLAWKIPWRRKWQPAPVFLPGKSHGQRSLAGYGPWGCKELDTTLQLNNNNNAKQNLSQCGFIHKTDKPRSICCSLSEILRGSQIKCVRSTCCLAVIFVFNLPKRSKFT